MVGRRTSAQPTAACEKAEVTCSENEVDGEGLTIVVHSDHTTGQEDGARAGLQEARQVRGRAESPNAPAIFYGLLPVVRRSPSTQSAPKQRS